MEWAAIWKLLQTFGLPIALVLSLLTGWHFQSLAAYWSAQYDQCQSDRKADKKNYEDASKKAAIANQKTVTDTETHWKGVVANNTKAYNEKLNEAFASVDAYAQRLRSTPSGTTSGGSRNGSVSATSGTPGVGQGASPSTDLPADANERVCIPKSDLYIGAENTVKAQKWQDLWNGFLSKWPK